MKHYTSASLLLLLSCKSAAFTKVKTRNISDKGLESGLYRVQAILNFWAISDSAVSITYCIAQALKSNKQLYSILANPSLRKMKEQHQ